jgi:hypothetical protein
MKPLSKYKIYWATLIPSFGSVTKRDAHRIDVMTKYREFRSKPEISIHGASKESVLKKIKAIENRGLFKAYKVFLYTDAQFGKWKLEEPLSAILTTKQKEESFTIN